MSEDIFGKLSKMLDDPQTFEAFKETMGITDQDLQGDSPPVSQTSSPMGGIDPSALLGNNFSTIDFSQIMGMMPLLQSMGGIGGGIESNSAQLLRALKPFLSIERQPKIDTALSILQLLELMPMISQLNLFTGGQQQ